MPMMWVNRLPTPSDPDYIINPPAVFLDVNTFAEYAARNRTQIIIGNTAVHETKTIYTVPANKVLYISSAWLATMYNVSVGSISVVISATETPLAAAYSTNGTQNFSNTYPMPLKLTANDTVKLYGSGAGLVVNGGFTGWLEDA